jgi:undecaprenyl diphosphate synthase
VASPAIGGAVAAAVADGEIVPEHIAIIMDGNRRWARARGLPAVFGHREGAQAVRRTVESCGKLGVRFVTLFAFSSENWSRPPAEVNELMNLLRVYIRQEITTLEREGVRVRMIGERGALAPDIVELIEDAERRTAANLRLDLVVALNYGGRREIVRAARAAAEEVRAGRLDPQTLDERQFARLLYTAELPDPDLLIRTSGELRISNFLLWQLAYTELVFLPVCWPEFEAAHLEAAIEEFRRRERRYGAGAR